MQGAESVNKANKVAENVEPTCTTYFRGATANERIVRLCSLIALHLTLALGLISGLLGLLPETGLVEPSAHLLLLLLPAAAPGRRSLMRASEERIGPPCQQWRKAQQKEQRRGGGPLHGWLKSEALLLVGVGSTLSRLTSEASTWWEKAKP
jgi:hypothetical protein